MARESRLDLILQQCRLKRGRFSRGQRGALARSVFCRRRLRAGWPWWLAAGLVGAPFLVELHIIEALVLLSILFLLHRFCSSLSCVARIAILLASGALWGMVFGQLMLNQGLPQEWVKKDVWATGVVDGLPESREGYLRFRFKVESVEYAGASIPWTSELLLNWYKPYPGLQAGQHWRLRLRLKPNHGSLNPGGFNYEQWLFSQGVGARGYVREADKATLLRGPEWAQGFDLLRERIGKYISARPIEFGGLISALAIGIRTDMTEKQWQVLRDTGTAHLMAISGLHIGMVAALGFLLGNRLWRYSLLHRTQFPAQYVGRLIALSSALIYAALAGFSLPTLRALLMLVAYFMLRLLRRNSGAGFTLGFVLLVVLLFNPLAPLGSGFWLSFGAVMAIVWALRSEHPSLSGDTTSSEPPGLKRRLVIKLLQWWRVQWAVFIGLFPLTLLFFQQVSVVMLLANFIAIPVVAMMVVPTILLALVFLVLGVYPVSDALLSIADGLLGSLWPLLQVLSELPISTYASPAPQPWVLLLSILAAGVVLKRSLGRWRLLAVAGVIPLFVSYSPAWEEGRYKVHVLDVGQGLAVVIQTGRHALVYDAGVKYPAGFDAGASVVLPFLRQKRVAVPEVIVASHDNQDHVGGLDAVISAYPGARRYASAAFYPGSMPCESALPWEWDGVHFSFLHPQQANRSTDNNASCVLMVESDFGSTLLTGDIEKQGEAALLRNALVEVVDTDLLLVPHHGSRSSSTQAFISRLDPLLAVISAGYLNRFEHPHPEVEARYQRHAIPVYNTASSGWVEVDFQRFGLRATPWRAIYRRYWMSPGLARSVFAREWSRSSTTHAPGYLQRNPAR